MAFPLFEVPVVHFPMRTESGPDERKVPDSLQVGPPDPPTGIARIHLVDVERGELSEVGVGALDQPLTENAERRHDREPDHHDHQPGPRQRTAVDCSKPPEQDNLKDHGHTGHTGSRSGLRQQDACNQQRDSARDAPPVQLFPAGSSVSPAAGRPLRRFPRCGADEQLPAGQRHPHREKHAEVVGIAERPLGLRPGVGERVVKKPEEPAVTRHELQQSETGHDDRRPQTPGQQPFDIRQSVNPLAERPEQQDAGDNGNQGRERFGRNDTERRPGSERPVDIVALP